MLSEPLVPFFQGQFDLQLPAFTFLTRAALCRFRERRQKRESDVYRLKVLCICMRDVMRQSARGRRQWGFDEFASKRQPRCIHARQPAHRYRFNVTFNARDLSGKEDVWPVAHLHRCAQHARRTNIRVAMDLSKLQKLRSEEHTSELQSQSNLVCRLLL